MFDIHNQLRVGGVRLTLMYRRSRVALCACDDEGELLDCGEILHITSEGKLLRIENCKVDGIQTDSEGRIQCS